MHLAKTFQLLGPHITGGVVRERKKEKKWGRKLGIIRRDSRRLNEDRLIQCVVRCYHTRLLKLNASELMTDDESYLPVKASDPQDLAPSWTATGCAVSRSPDVQVGLCTRHRLNAAIF